MGISRLPGREADIVLRKCSCEVYAQRDWACQQGSVMIVRAVYSANERVSILVLRSSEESKEKRERGVKLKDGKIER